jgi:hypothetical protein
LSFDELGELEHTPDHRQRWLHQALNLRDRLTAELADRNSPFARMMDIASSRGMAALRRLLEADLTNPEGVADARFAQAECCRYFELCDWIAEAMTTGDQAESEIRAAEQKEETEMDDDQGHPDT